MPDQLGAADNNRRQEVNLIFQPGLLFYDIGISYYDKQFVDK